MNNSIYIFIESLKNTFDAGGVVMLPILIVGVIGFYCLYSNWMRIGGDFFRKDIGRSVDIMRKDLNSVLDGAPESALKVAPEESPDGASEKGRAEKKGGDFTARIQMAIRHLESRRCILSRELRYALKVAAETPEKYSDYMQVRMIKTVRYMEQGTHVISVMAAAAPLLGLLGTVTGMVSTFEVITLYGNQNPVLMADGISEALISTQSGLLVAFPLTLMIQRLDERTEILKQQLQLGATIIENYISDRA